MVKKIFFAVQLWGTESALIYLFKKIEELGFDAAYYGDGPFNWLLDCYSVLASASMLTSKLRIGPAVTYLEGSYRHPLATIKALFTLSLLSNNRIDARFGFIQERAREYWLKFGIELPSLKDRIERIEEAIIIMKELMNKGVASLRGKHYVVELYDFKPIAKVPLCISANKRKTIEITLKYADIWEISYLPPNKIMEILDVYEEKLKNIELSLETDVIIGKNELDFKKKFSEYLSMRKNQQDFILSAIKGTPEQCIKSIEKYIKLGIKRFILSFNEIPNTESLELFSKEVLSSF